MSVRAINLLVILKGSFHVLHHQRRLLPEDEDAWLDPDLTEVEPILTFLRPYPDDLLEAVRAA